MKIKSRLTLNTFISLGVATVILFALVWSFRGIVTAERNMDLVVEMRKVAFERILLRDKFLLYREKQLGTQWHAKTATLMELLALSDRRFEREADQALLHAAQNDFNATLAGFSGIIEGQAGDGPGQYKMPGFSEAELQVISQVFAKAASLTDNINRLHESAHREAELARNMGAFSIALVVLCGAMVLVINSALIARTLTKRLVALGEGVERVGGGDLEHRIAADGDDELAVVTGEFNNMLDVLAESEAGLQRLHRQNELILNAAGEGIYQVDVADQILFANPAAGRMLGYHPTELVGKNSHQLFHHTRPDGTPYPRAECPLQKSIRDGEVCRGQNEVFWTRDGRMFPVEHVNAPILEQGQVVGAVVVFRDISDRKAADDALLQSATRLSEAQHLAGLGHWELDLSSNELQWSDEVYRIFGLQPGEFAANYEAFLARIHPEDRDKVDQAYSQSLQRRSNYEIEHRLLLPNGEIRHVQERCVTKYDAAGTPLRSLGTVLNITERKLAEHILEEKEARLRLLIESIPDLIWLKDSEGIYLACNSMFEQFFGAKEAEIVGKSDYDFVSRELADFFRDHDKKAMAVGKPSSNLEWITFASDGHRALLNTIKTPMFDADGVLLGVLGIGRDVTEYQKLEEQLRQAQKMEAIGTLAGGIAHDFNNILTAILGYGELVLEQLPPDSQLHEEQGQVIRAGKRASELVKQILTFSRRSEQQLQPLQIQFVVKEALKLLRASIPSSIEIRQDVDVNCGPVLADPVQIHQVVMNLSTNAYQAMRETGGLLKVSLSTQVVEEASIMPDLHPGPHVCLEVADTGCGMDSAVQARIFEPYYTTKGKGEGTGLGLALVHGIVTGLGGVVHVYSEPGQGTTFKVYLPLIAGGASEVVAGKGVIPAGGDESILVVDDEEVLARWEQRVLTGLGYRVTIFTDSREALQAFRAKPEDFDLVLTDMTMPELNGAELAREMIGIRPGMPVILCSGFSTLIDAGEARALGIRAFLQKPVEKADLARAVRRVLDEVKDVGPVT